MKRNIIFLVALWVCTSLFAQGEIDAFRLSSSDLRGTARGQAMGGAFGALGGDVTGIMINPAGLGLYRSSEINTTLAFTSTGIQTDWNNTTHNESKFKFNFDNISYVGYFPTGKEGANVLNFAFSYNRLKNFDRRFSASGTDMKQSLTDYIAAITSREGIYSDQLNSYNNTFPWLSILGWQGYLINDTKDNQYAGLFPGEAVAPKLAVTEKGHVETYDFSLGTNISDKFYLGMTFGLTNVQYRLDSYYGETFLSGGTIGLNNYFETQGTGFQLTLGGIWRPVDFLRLGVAYHSPTWYNFTDYYQGKTTANYPGIQPNTTATTPQDGAFSDYRLNIPSSWVFSAAGIFGKVAILSVDYEIKDYRSMHLMDSYGYAKKQDNKYIDEDFKLSSTIRAGLELRFTHQLSGRLGYSSVQNPYEKDFRNGKKEVAIVGTVPHYTLEGCASYYTAGIGYRFTPQFYMDVTFVYKTQKDDLYYFPSLWNNEGNFIVESTPATLTNNTYKGLVTFGYKF